MLLRGDAGSGKTTLLEWLAVRAARGELSGALAEWNDCVPFVVRLRAFADGDLPAPERFVSLSTPMIAEVTPEGWVHRLFKAGRAMLLVDGVDEVPAPRRRVVKTWLRDLLAAFPDVRVVVTARVAAADSRWLAKEEFNAVTLEPMNPSDILDFVERWHQAAELSGANVGDAGDRLRSQLERPHLRQLAASPLLCAMLCALNLTHRSELPRNRMELYAKALAMLLHLRDAERGIPGLLGDTEKRVLLRDLAWRLTLANRVELPTTEALDHITRKLPGIPSAGEADPKLIVAHLLERSCVLREPVPGRVDFVHRTFLEYLAADEAIQQHHVDTLIAHAHLDTWWETIVMASGHATTTQASHLLTGILDRAEQEQTNARRLRLLAAASLETVRDIAPQVSGRVDAMVRAKLTPPRNLKEVGSLMSIGPRILRYLPDSLDALSTAKAHAAVRAATLAGTVDALPLLASYAQDSRAVVHSELHRAWRYFDPERYADVVLANSRLYDGRLTVWSRRHVPYVRRISAMTALHLQLQNDLVEGLDLFAGLPALKMMSVRLRPSTPHDIRLLSESRELETLHLGGLQATADLSPLADLPALTDVALMGYQDEALSGLATLDGVLRLVLFSPTDNDTIGHAARVFRSTKVLNVSEFELSDLESITSMASIEELWLQNSHFDSIAPLTRMTSLRELDISNNVSFDYDLGPLATLNLRSVTLDKDQLYSGVNNLGCEVRFE